MMPFKFRFNKNSKALVLILVFSFALASPIFSQKSQKNSKKELENKKKKIAEEIKEINAMLSETKAHKKTSIGALVTINLKLQKRQDLINTINAEIREIDKEVGVNESQIQQLKNNLEKLKKEYARMVIFAQRNQDAYNALMYIFAADNFNQAYARLKYMQQYSEFRKKQALEIINTQTLLLAKINELKEQRRNKNILLGNEVEEKKVLNVEKQEKEEVLSSLQKKEKELKTELTKRKQAAIQLQLSIKRLIEEEIRRKAEEANKIELARLLAAKKARENKSKTEKTSSNPSATIEAAPTLVKTEKKETAVVPVLTEEAEALSTDFSNNRGKLPWPVAKGLICETYGEHEHPAIKGFMMFNNGLEICATKGTQVRAVFEGEVTSIAVSPTGGKLVIIRHGEYLSVYCNLSDVLVKTGQKVNVKQVIGTIMHDEDEDKTSFNFQIWKGQKTMDPGGWLFNAR